MRRKAASIVTFLVVFVGIVVGARRWSPGQAFAQLTDSFIYLPLISRPLTLDLAVTGMEITQSVQTPDNSVPLVANRNTIVRVFAQTVNGSSPNNIRVSLSCNGNTQTQGPTTIPTTPTRDNYGSTFNFALPPACLSGNVNLVAIVDSTDVAEEQSEGNNQYSTTEAFNYTPPLQVVIVPIDYTHTPPDPDEFYPGQAKDDISDWIMRAYPVHDVDISYRAPYAFTGNLEEGDAWSQLLYEMRLLKVADGESNSPKVYYGYIPVENGSARWFYGGIAGLGYIGYRASIGLDLSSWGPDRSGILAGHEIGHNFGRYHAPCNVSGDPDYPYPGASVGQYGLDVLNNKLLSPNDYVDMMSYCSPEWVSDYTYTGLYNDQQANGYTVAATAESALVLQATLNDDGTAEFRPTYSFPTFLSQPAKNPDYAAQLLDRDGNVIAQHPVTVREAHEEGIHVRHINAVLPLPKTAVTQVRLIHMHDDAVVAQRQLSTASKRQTTAQLVETADSLQLSWGDNGRPAIVRYTADDGATWTTVGLNVTGGRFEVNPGDLPEKGGRFEIILADGVVDNTLSVER